MNHTESATAAGEALVMAREGSDLRVRLTGQWTLQHRGLPTTEAVRAEMAQKPPAKLSFDLAGVKEYDTALITFLLKCHDLCATTKTTFDMASLTEGPRNLLTLATSVPEAADVRPHADRAPLFARIGDEALIVAKEGKEIFSFLGEITVATWRLFTGRARFR
ncbi:MAG: hypothetical protein ABSH19_09070, partial [Opitutales bacterium]